MGSVSLVLSALPKAIIPRLIKTTPFPESFAALGDSQRYSLLIIMDAL